MQHGTKMLGGISCIALVAFSILGSFIPFVGVFTLIAGIVLLVAFFMAGSQLGRSDIKRNLIICIVLNVGVAVVFMFAMGATMIVLMSAGGSTGLDGFGALGATALIGGILCWLTLIASNWFWYKASVGLAEGSNTPLFQTGGLVMFIGAILLIVFGLGAIAILAGQIMQAIAFFNAPERDTASVATPA